MNKLEKWCRGNLTTEQVDLYFDKLSHIPGKVFEQIVDSRVSNMRPQSQFPSPSELLQDWHSWQGDNPQQISDRNEEECQECRGNGVLYYWIGDNGYVCACASCENWRKAFPTRGPSVPARLTKDEILEQGWLLHNPKKMGPYRDEKSQEQG